MYSFILDVHTIQLHMNSEEPSDESSQNNHNQQIKNDLIFEDITLEPGTLMTVFHCPMESCAKKNYLDAKSVKTHCRRIHSMIDYEGMYCRDLPNSRNKGTWELGRLPAYK